MANTGLSGDEIRRRMDAAARFKDTGTGWMKRAAAELNLNATTLRCWYNEQGIYTDSIQPIEAQEPEEPLAMRQERKFRDEISRLKNELSQTHRELNNAEDLRESVFGLREPIRPADFRPNLKLAAADHAEIPILSGS